MEFSKLGNSLEHKTNGGGNKNSTNDEMGIKIAWQRAGK